MRLQVIEKDPQVLHPLSVYRPCDGVPTFCVHGHLSYLGLDLDTFIDAPDLHDIYGLELCQDLLSESHLILFHAEWQIRYLDGLCTYHSVRCLIVG